MKPLKLKIQWNTGVNKAKLMKQFLEVGASVLPEGPHGDWVLCQDNHIAEQAYDIADKNGCVLADTEHIRWDPFDRSMGKRTTDCLVMSILEKVYP